MILTLHMPLRSEQLRWRMFKHSLRRCSIDFLHHAHIVEIAG